MLTTSLKLASASLFFALSSPSSICFASSISSSAFSNGTFPISFKYIRTGSSRPMPSGMDKSSFDISILDNSSSRPASSISSTSSSTGSCSLSMAARISTLVFSSSSKILSNNSPSMEASGNSDKISSYFRVFLFFAAISSKVAIFSLNVVIFSSIFVAPSFQYISDLQ